MRPIPLRPLGSAQARYCHAAAVAQRTRAGSRKGGGAHRHGCWRLQRRDGGVVQAPTHPDVARAGRRDAILSLLRRGHRGCSSSDGRVVHAAAQPSHDWAATNPFLDFNVNAYGTLNLLENTRNYCKDAVFIFTSTNKVYGDNPNKIDYEEKEKRYSPIKGSPYEGGFDEQFSIDNTMHSLFGASKLSADIITQEYGKYFGMKTVAFRGGCLTGGGHAGTMLHGFLSYLVKCVESGTKYNIFGYKGKQVRDNIHSLDLVNCFHEFYNNPKSGEVYNIGGGNYSNCSMLEAIDIAENIVSKKLRYEY